MQVVTEKFIRKAKPVDAVQVTLANIDDAASWCGGLHVPPPGIGDENNTEPYIHVPIRSQRDDVDNKAFPGKWIVREGHGFYRVMNDKPFNNTFERVAKPKPATPTPAAMPKKASEPTQVGAVEVVPGTPPNEGSPLTTGTKEHQVNRSAESGEFVTEAQAQEHPETTVTETVVTDDGFTPEERAEYAALEAEDASAEAIATEQDNKEKEENVEESGSFNHDEMTQRNQAEDAKEALISGDEVAPGDMVDPMQAEEDSDGTVQLGVPIEEVALPEEDSVPALCGSCGSEVVDGVCSKDTEHDIHGTAPDSEPVSTPRILPGD